MQSSEAVDAATERYQLAVPASLRTLAIWLVWRFEASETAGKKPLKVPYYINGARRAGVQGSDDDRKRLVSFEHALQAFGTGQWSGLGIAMLPGIGINAWDFDNAVDASGVPFPQVESLLRASGSYVELSPSGKGFRMLSLGHFPSVKRLHPDGYNVELFGGSGFVTITGRMFCGEDIVALPGDVQAMLGEWLQADTSKPAHGRLDQLAGARAADPVYQHLKTHGHIKRDWNDGRSSITCPFEAEHSSGSGNSDTVYFLPNTNGYAQGHFACLHAHCTERPDSAFLDALGVVAPVVDIAAVLSSLKTRTGPENAPAAPVQPAAPSVHTPIDWAEVGRNPPPPRQWAIENWIGRGHVTLQAGKGGVGKTLILQQQASCLAMGRPFLGEIDECFTSLIWCAEDDAQELSRRQIAIASWLQVPIGLFTGKLYAQALAGVDCALMTISGGRLQPTRKAFELWEQVNDYKISFLGLDNVAHLFTGNENDRYHVTSFINLLSGMCITANVACVLNAHPGKAAESEFSGSTAWENAVRSRLFLSRNPPGEPETESDTTGNIRYLSRRKANYSALDSKRFVYDSGVLKPDDDALEAENSPLVREIKAKRAARIILNGIVALDKMGVNAGVSPQGANYLPKLLATYQLTEGMHKTELANALAELMRHEKVRVGVVGKYSKGTPKHGLVVVQ